MPKFFEDRTNFRSNNVIIKGDNFNHLSKVLRADIGDEIVVTDNFGIDYNCVINGIFSDSITARIEDFMKNENEPDVEIHMFQCLPKFDKMDSIIQKCVELGVQKIYPVVSSRCITKVDDESGAKKVMRWQRISEASAKQCGRGIIPEIWRVISFKDAVNIAADMDCAIIPFEREEKISLNSLDIKGKKTIAIFIGPEGGFDDEEVDLCISKGITPVTLGKRILRTETAGINALSIVLFLIENL